MTSSICPCDGSLENPAIWNPSALSHIAYRTGDFLSIREALLRPLPGEQELSQWRPSAKRDLAVQMVEWWAYLGDILTFYNERIANQAYLRTADLPESVRNLIRLLGYRPRPGIAAHGVVAALISGNSSFALPKGFAIDSKPGPGQSPQTFELDSDTLLKTNESIAAIPQQQLFAPDSSHFFIQGASGQVVAGDYLLLTDLSGAPSAGKSGARLLNVTSVQIETFSGNIKRTKVTFAAVGDLPPEATTKSIRIRKATQSSAIWTADGNGLGISDPDITAGIPGEATPRSQVHLAGLVRGILPGDSVLFVSSTGDPKLPPKLLKVDSVQDVVWYLNPANSMTPPVPPAPPAIPLPVLHTQLTPDSRVGLDPTTTTAYFAWQDLTSVIDQPIASIDQSSFTLSAIESGAFRSTPDGSEEVLLEDATGIGAEGSASNTSDGLIVTLPEPSPGLTPPINVLYNLLPVSRGKTIVNEILGSGDASVPAQTFILQKSPLTYYAKGDSFVSSLEVRVNGRLWKEMLSFYGQPRDAEIFVTYEDETQKTHVTFGDGVSGARLPTGNNNVIATYRYGSGAAAPSAGQLTNITQPYPNVRAVRAPTAMWGGADPDPSDQIRKYAPRSVLTFGRAVSGDDYEVIAAQAPGVTRAKSYWSFSAVEQRAVVKLYVGGDANAVDSAQKALLATSDPNRQVEVVLAKAVLVDLRISIIVDPRYAAADVVAQVSSLLADTTNGLFASARLGIGQPIFDSQIAETCLEVPGCTAVRNLALTIGKLEGGPRHVPGEGAFFQLNTTEVSPDGG